MKTPGEILPEFFARYARQAAAVPARADICRATDSEQLCCELKDTPGRRPPCLHEQTFARQAGYRNHGKEDNGMNEGQALHGSPYVEQIEKFAHSLRQLSKTFLGLEETRQAFSSEEIENMFARVREKVCGKCEKCGWCNSMITFSSKHFYKWNMSTEVNPMLLGIGFIIGIDVSIVMIAGTIFAQFAVAPLLSYFVGMAGSSFTVWNDASVQLNQADTNIIVSSYLKYIGAGMMLGGGIIGALKLIPAIKQSITETVIARKNSDGKNSDKFGSILLLLGTILMLVVSFFFARYSIAITIIGGLLSIILSFLFVIVSARMAGLIGASNNPVSGMTIASMVILTLIFAICG